MPALQVAKDSIDLGIVVRDGPKMLAFYKDTLGLPLEGTLPMAGGGKMDRILIGTTVLKLVTQGKLPAGSNPPGGMAAATGMRYFTITVKDVDAVTKQAEAGGAPVRVKPVDFRPGIRISIVEDPDGNWVEFLQQTPVKPKV
ncbi:Glyoxalase/Bleomycin resistance protein/Dihydroxybiphenyl dioxygenase [Hyaloraphidium curvatum]|nr:Glyoxalase/Bleomycin resistance protein/Dihydroxybiphenyl dioxygenase [Hyaloraphidium curvatum]